MINPTAIRFFKLFLLITLGGPLVVGVLMLISVPTGLSYVIFLPLLYCLNFYFTPIHAIFGDQFVRVGEFGMNPQGMQGYVAAVVFYIGASYAAANLLGAFLGRKKITSQSQKG